MPGAGDAAPGAGRGVPAAEWYETVPFADGVTLVHEPWMTPFFRAHMWLVRGRDRDLVVDAGLGHVPLRARVPALRGRPVTLVLSHTHWDHIGAAHEFDGPEDERLAHPAEAAVLADPDPARTLYAAYADGSRDAEVFARAPEGWDAGRHRIRPAPATRLVGEGDRIDLGDRVLTVLHTPGHSPGHLALWEERTGTLFAQDAVYDGPLVDDVPGSDAAAYRRTMARLAAELRPRIVHGGHFPSFGRVRFGQAASAYLARAESFQIPA